MGEKRLTRQEFQMAVDSLNLNTKTIQIAWAVLVDGRKQSDLAAEHLLSKGAISQTVTKVWEARALPPGFERVTEILPRHQAFIVRKWGKAFNTKTEKTESKV